MEVKYADYRAISIECEERTVKDFFFFSNSALLEPPKEAQWETKEGAVYILRSLGNYFAVVDILK